MKKNRKLIIVIFIVGLFFSYGWVITEGLLYREEILENVLSPLYLGLVCIIPSVTNRKVKSVELIFLYMYFLIVAIGRVYLGLSMSEAFWKLPHIITNCFKQIALLIVLPLILGVLCSCFEKWLIENKD